MNITDGQERNVGINNSIGKCNCNRSPITSCVGWHNLNEQQYQFMLEQYQLTKTILPTHNPIQNWTIEEKIAGTK